MTVYDLAPGQLIEHDGDEPLTQEELDNARAELAGGAKLKDVAKGLGARVHEPKETEVVMVAIEREKLADLAERAGADEDERRDLGIE